MRKITITSKPLINKPGITWLQKNLQREKIEMVNEKYTYLEHQMLQLLSISSLISGLCLSKKRSTTDRLNIIFLFLIRVSWWEVDANLKCHLVRAKSWNYNHHRRMVHKVSSPNQGTPVKRTNKHTS